MELRLALDPCVVTRRLSEATPGVPNGSVIRHYRKSFSIAICPWARTTDGVFRVATDGEPSSILNAAV